MITGKNNIRVGQTPIRPQLFEQASNLFVEVIHDCIVNRQLIEHIIACARPRQQFFVAAFEIAVIKRMPRHEILRQFHLGRRVSGLITGRIDQWIMRTGEIDMQKKRLISFAFQKGQRPVGNMPIGQRRQSDALFQIRFALRIFKRPISVTCDRPPFTALYHLISFPSTPSGTK